MDHDRGISGNRRVRPRIAGHRAWGHRKEVRGKDGASKGGTRDDEGAPKNHAPKRDGCALFVRPFDIMILECIPESLFRLRSSNRFRNNNSGIHSRNVISNAEGAQRRHHFEITILEPGRTHGHSFHKPNFKWGTPMLLKTFDIREETSTFEILILESALEIILTNTLRTPLSTKKKFAKSHFMRRETPFRPSFPIQSKARGCDGPQSSIIYK